MCMLSDVLDRLCCHFGSRTRRHFWTSCIPLPVCHMAGAPRSHCQMTDTFHQVLPLSITWLTVTCKLLHLPVPCELQIVFCAFYESWYKGSITLSIWILVVVVKRMKPVSVFHWLGQCSDILLVLWADKKGNQFVKAHVKIIFKGSFWNRWEKRANRHLANKGSFE